MASDLAWWEAQRRAPNPDPAAMHDLLDRLKAWKIRHDEDRARQPGPFLQLAWGAVFGDEDEQVTEAIRQIQDALKQAS